MLAMVASSTTISWAMQMSTRAQPRCRWPGGVGSAACRRRSLRRGSWCLLAVGRWGGAAGGGREDDLVDDPLDERRVGDRLAQDEDAVQDDPREGRAEQVEVDVRARARRGRRRAGRSRCDDLRPWAARTRVAELGRRTRGRCCRAVTTTPRTCVVSCVGEAAAARRTAATQVVAQVAGVAAAPECLAWRGSRRRRRGSAWCSSAGRASPCWPWRAGRRRPW